MGGKKKGGGGGGGGGGGPSLAALAKALIAHVPQPQQKKKGKGKKKKKNRRAQDELAGIQQGVGAVTRAPFGSGKGNLLAYFEADDPAHLALPRQVGEYSVIRLTGIVLSSDYLTLFTTFQKNHTESVAVPSGYLEVGTAYKQWSNGIAMSWRTGTGLMNAALGANVWGMSALSMRGSTFVPSALTVQLMNPQSIQETKGIVYMGRMRTQQQMQDLAITAASFSDHLISFNNPRLLAAAKLAFRGVRASAIPFNMNALSEFLTGDSTYPAGATPYTSASPNPEMIEPFGFAPIFVINPNAIQLQYLVTVEYRIRFDSFNPAQASHRLYRAAPQSTWDSAIAGMHALGNGVRDIVDVVSQNGQLASSALSVMKALSG